MEKFYAKLALIMALLGAGAIFTALGVPYWSTEHSSRKDFDYYTGLFTCRMKNTDSSSHDTKCDFTDVWGILPTWMVGLRGVMVTVGLLTGVIVIMLLVYICQQSSFNLKLMKLIIAVCFITGVLLLTAVILSAVKFKYREDHLGFGWAYGLAIGSTVDYFIISVPLCFEKQTIPTGTYESI